jgi:hypothetical protein
MGVVRNASGTPTLAFTTTSAGVLRVWRLSYLADNVWADNGTPVSVIATTQWMGYAPKGMLKPTEVRVIAETGNGSSTPQTLGITAQNSNSSSDIATATAPAAFFWISASVAAMSVSGSGADLVSSFGK